MTLTVITPPAGEAVSLSQAKQFLRIGHDGEDARVTDLVAAARARLEAVSGLALVTRSLRRTWWRWPQRLVEYGVRLSPGPVTNLLAVRSVSVTGIVTDRTDRFRLVDGRLCQRGWSLLPALGDGGHVEIDYETGFGPPGSVPEDLVEAVLRLTADSYRADTEQAVGPVPDAVQSIVDARRQVRL